MTIALTPMTRISRYVAIVVLCGDVMLASCATLSDSIFMPTTRPADLSPRDTSADWLGKHPAETTSDPRVEDNVIWGF